MSDKSDELQLCLVSAFSRYWLEDLRKSSCTLTAVFHNSAYRNTMLREMTEIAESNLHITPPAGERLEKRVIAVSEAATQRGIPLDETWAEVLPGLRAIAGANEVGKPGAWKSAKLSRSALRKTNNP